MPGRGPAPKPERYRRGTPSRGEWKLSPDGGWQHDLPEPPSGISPAAATVWDGWFRSWWAANWTPDDLPALRFVIRLYDRVSRGDVKRAPELRQWMDGYGITPKGQQDRRWVKPLPPRGPSKLDRFIGGRYDHLRGEPIDKSRFTVHPDDSDRQPYRSRFKDIIEPRP
jgi:hypothetical protein